MSTSIHTIISENGDFANIGIYTDLHEVPEQYMTVRISELSDAEPVDDQGRDIVIPSCLVGSGHE